MSKLKKILLCTLILLSINTQAKSLVVGIGTVTCAEYVKYRRIPNKEYEFHIVNWVQGYLSGVNTYRADLNQKTVDLPNSDTIALMIESECLKTPEFQIVFMARAVYQRLLQK